MTSDDDQHPRQHSETQHVETDTQRLSEAVASTPPLLESGSQEQTASGQTTLYGGDANDGHHDGDDDYVDNPPLSSGQYISSRKSKRSSLSIFGGSEGPGPSGRKFSLSEENETRTDVPETPPAGNGNGNSEDGEPEEKPQPISWSQLPQKSQLFILVCARLAEPLTQTSLQSYLFYQLKSFNPSLSDSAISSQAGIFQGSFTAAQFLTSVWWGRLADSPRMGRKRVLLIGLCGTLISCLGFGFSKSFTSAIIFRILGGFMNSNVGVMRTMISEIIVEKK
jgi:Major Facilitator Superfamily